MSQFGKLTQITPVKIKELNPEHLFIFFPPCPEFARCTGVCALEGVKFWTPVCHLTARSYSRPWTKILCLLHLYSFLARPTDLQSFRWEDPRPWPAVPRSAYERAGPRGRPLSLISSKRSQKLGLCLLAARVYLCSVNVILKSRCLHFKTGW